MDNDTLIIIVFASLIGLFMITKLFSKPIDPYIKRQSYADRHDQYVKILEYYMEKAFDVIYKDRILVYSIEGTKPDEKDIKQNSIDFAKLTFKLIGRTLIEDLIYLYGDEETLIFIVVECFNTKAEHDEIKQASINSIMEGSENEII
jgi:hypothetical protein